MLRVSVQQYEYQIAWLYIVTLTIFKDHLIVTVTIFKKYLIFTRKKLKFYKMSPTPSKYSLVRPQKCRNFVYWLRGTQIPKGNQLPVIASL